MLIAAVGGILLTLVVGTARITQLRRRLTRGAGADNAPESPRAALGERGPAVGRLVLFHLQVLDGVMRTITCPVVRLWEGLRHQRPSFGHGLTPTTVSQRHLPTAATAGTRPFGCFTKSGQRRREPLGRRPEPRRLAGTDTAGSRCKCVPLTCFLRSCTRQGCRQALAGGLGVAMYTGGESCMAVVDGLAACLDGWRSRSAFAIRHQPRRRPLDHRRGGIDPCSPNCDGGTVSLWIR
jgi:hypothetical protein